MALGRDGNQRMPYQPINPMISRTTPYQLQSGASPTPRPAAIVTPSAQTSPNGMPSRPEFQSILNSDGSLQSPFRAGFTNAAAHTMSTDMSPWLGLQGDRISQEQANSRDQLNRDTSLSIGSGFSNLAATGGLDSGARERMVTSANMNRMQGLSGVGQQSAASRLDAAIQAEMMKKQAQQFNAGARNQNSIFNAGAQNQNSIFNTGNAISGRMGQNAFNSEMYGQDMQAWGAGKTADAAKKNNNSGTWGSNTWFDAFGR